MMLVLPRDFNFFEDRGAELYPTGLKITKQDSVWIEKTLAEMSLREKCAQLVVPYAMSKDTSEDSEGYQRLVRLVKDLKVGGIIFFQGEVDKQAVLTNKLQKISDVPLLICSDYERGLGMRLDDAVEFPYSMALAAAGDPRLTYEMGKIIANEGRALGVHLNFAPLLDVNHDYRNPIINVRAYSEKPNIIALQSEAFINGMNDGGMLTTGKHFPGHGGTDLDSHNELSLIERSETELYKVDLLPFREAIKAHVKAIMIGHLEVPALEKKKGLPATFSKSIVTDLLQHQMGFDGLVVTDAMNMHSIINNYSHEEAAKLAVMAGNDIVLFPVDEEAAINGIYNAVADGELSERRIEKSVRKILGAKAWLGLEQEKYVDVEKLHKTLENKYHHRLAEEIAGRSITLLKNEHNLIPIDPDDYYSTALITITNSSRKPKDPLTFVEAVDDEFNYVKKHNIHLRSKEKDYQKAFQTAKKSNLIILPIYLSVRAFQGTLQIDSVQLNFIKKIISLNKPTIVISFGNPYILGEFPEVPTYLCSYGETKVSQKAMMDAILGRHDILGKLPISIPNTEFKIGYGLELQNVGLDFAKGGEDKDFNFTAVDSLMKKGIADSIFPGGVLLVAKCGKVIYHKPFGRQTYNAKSEKITTSSIFDLASLTKVIAATSAAMMLVDKEKISLDDKVVDYLPGFGNNGKENITIKNLLLHNSGLPSFIPFYKYNDNPDAVINKINNSKLVFNPGTKYLYSDLGMIALQLVIEKVTGTKLDKFLDKELFNPLGMNRTMFNPPPKYWHYCVPTEVDDYWRMSTLKGKVHDETAYILNGVAGHAGLFSTAKDLSLFMQMILNKGYFAGKYFFNATTVTAWTSKQSELSSRALGWDTKSKGYSSAGQEFSDNSFGHTGFTGTSIWADKDRDLFVILLTNRVHPTRDNREIIKFRPQLHNAVIDAVTH